MKGFFFWGINKKISYEFIGKVISNMLFGRFNLSKIINFNIYILNKSY